MITSPSQALKQLDRQVVQPGAGCVTRIVPILVSAAGAQLSKARVSVRLTAIFQPHGWPHSVRNSRSVKFKTLTPKPLNQTLGIERRHELKKYMLTPGDDNVAAASIKPMAASGCPLPPRPLLRVRSGSGSTACLRIRSLPGTLPRGLPSKARVSTTDGDIPASRLAALRRGTAISVIQNHKPKNQTPWH